LEAPFLCIVEAKKDDFEQGLAQCLVEMKACRYSNQQLNQLLDIFGIVTNGNSWEFYCLQLDGWVYGTETYSIGSIADLLGRLHYIFQQCEQNLLEVLRVSKSMFEKCPAVKTATTSTKSACADSRKIKGLRNLRRQVLYL
jgi:hypothetical protein